MNIFQKAAEFILPKNLINKLNQQLYQWQIFPGETNNLEDDPDVYLEQGYNKNTDVNSIVNKRESMRKQSRLRLMRRKPDGTEEEVVNDHELLRFKKKVNATMSTGYFTELFHIFRAIVGESFTYMIKQSSANNTGKTLEVYSMPANDVEIIEGTWMDPIRGYTLSNQSGQSEFTTEEVVQSKVVNPNFGNGTMHGMSPLRASRMTLDKQNSAIETQTKQFNNQGPDKILYRDSTGTANGGAQSRMTDPQQAELGKKIKKHTNKHGNKLPMVLKDKMGLITLGSSITDLDIIESTKDGLIKFCNMLFMPPELFGLEATYSNQVEARQAAWTDSIIPSNKIFTDHLDEVTINCVPEYEGLFWSYDYSDVEVLQSGQKVKVETLNAGHASVNEVREAIGLPKSDNKMLDEPQLGSNIVFPSELGDIEDDPTKKDYSDYTDK